MKFVACSIITVAATIRWSCSAMVIPSSKGSVVAQFRAAIDLTQRANTNPSYATEACSLWSFILARETCDECPLPPDAMSAAHALYASALTRIGRDKDAILEYQTSLDFLGACQNDLMEVTNTEFDIRLGLGKSLQRLLRYRKARMVFLGIISRCGSSNLSEKSYSYCAEAVTRSVLCCMRLGDLDSACKIINDFEEFANSRVQEPEVAGMKGMLLLLRSATESERLGAYCLLQYASENSSSFLYKWLHFITEQKWNKSNSFINRQFIIEQLAEINNSAFDDHCLIYLDDKLLLHSIVLKGLAGSDQFFPQSFVLPEDMSSFMHEHQRETRDGALLTKCRWMLKDRSGYGSHGNRLVSDRDAAVIEDIIPRNESALCQRIVHPAMLLEGRKFSLRIYVVYFPKGLVFSGGKLVQMEADVFLSTEGLVKFASAEFSDGDLKNNDLTDNQYMTNSGRGDGRSSVQHDLEYLRKELNRKDYLAYNHLWSQIQNIVQCVMRRYIAIRDEEISIAFIESDLDECSSGIPQSCTSQSLSCLPKILGFDFIMDAYKNPWLLEVNRFPGLEPRSSMDATVKQTVIYDAWLAAADRVQLDRTAIVDIRPLNYKSYSLIRVFTK